MLTTAIRNICKFKNIIKNQRYSSKYNIIRSNIEISIPNIFIEEYVWTNLDKWHSRTATVCAETGRSYSYSDIYQKSRNLSSFLYKFSNLNHISTVGIVLPNIPEYPIVYLGIIQSGLKVTTINPLNTPDEISKQLLDCKSTLIFTISEFWPKIAKVEEMLKQKISVVVIKHKETEACPREAIKFNEVIQDYQPFKVNRNIDDVIVIPYSSGTTGKMKGVQLTNKNVVSNLSQMGSPKFNNLHNENESDQVIIPTILPMFHVYCMVMGLLHTLAMGCKLITIPKFGSNIFLKVLEEHRITFMYLVPPIMLFLINNDQIKPRHVEKIKSIVTGAAPLGITDIEKFQKRYNGIVNILQAYGQTEAGPLTHLQTLHIPQSVKVGGVGNLIPNTECKVVAVDDETLTGLGPNQSGELLIRGPQVMKGYLNNEILTRHTLTPDGWLRTGDIGHYDEDKQFFITDRLKELIKVKGFQVAPAELEELLRNHPDIEDAAVTGVPHKYFGEVPKAFIVLKTNTNIHASKIHDYLNKKVSDYKQLVGGIVFTTDIPKTASGKIQRHLLKKM